jgi:hypothetical protein
VKERIRILLQVRGADLSDEGNEASASALIRTAKGEIAREGADLQKLPDAVVHQLGEQALRAVYRQYSNPKFLADRLTVFGQTLARSCHDPKSLIRFLRSCRYQGSQFAERLGTRQVADPFEVGQQMGVGEVGFVRGPASGRLN